jgi:hypothetical protein
MAVQRELDCRVEQNQIQRGVKKMSQCEDSIAGRPIASGVPALFLFAKPNGGKAPPRLDA